MCPMEPPRSRFYNQQLISGNLENLLLMANFEAPYGRSHLLINKHKKTGIFKFAPYGQFLLMDMLLMASFDCIYISPVGVFRVLFEKWY